MFSDGYADQFGGEQGRKFMYSKFRELLLQIHSKPMEEQKQILDTTIENWKGGKHKQIDDILIIGFKVG
jgi:serine phosphatase RsbU (regulator of sigma subunit)